MLVELQHACMLATGLALRVDERTWYTTRCRWVVEDCSAWTEMMSAPALAKSGMRCSGSTIICASSPRHVQFKVIGHCPMLVPVPVPLLCAGSAACCPALPCCYCAPWTHQMAVQHLVGDGAQGLDHQGANGDVGHEAAVHDINVHPVAAGRVDGPDLCAILDDQC